jgi:hypothetical protein
VFQTLQKLNHLNVISFEEQVVNLRKYIHWVVYLTKALRYLKRVCIAKLFAEKLGILMCPDIPTKMALMKRYPMSKGTYIIQILNALGGPRSMSPFKFRKILAEDDGQIQFR